MTVMVAMMRMKDNDDDGTGEWASSTLPQKVFSVLRQGVEAISIASAGVGCFLPLIPVCVLYGPAINCFDNLPGHENAGSICYHRTGRK